MEDCVIPARLPCIVLQNQVLLPTAFAKITFSARSSALLEHLGSGGKDVFMAVIPEQATAMAGSKVEQEQDSHMRPVSQDKVGSVATAGRVLQLSRVVQTGDWVLLLEGLCRVSIDALMPSDDIEEEFDYVRVTQLELRPPGAPALPPTDHTTSPQAPPSSASDATLADLGKQLKATTRVLLRQLARSTGGAVPTRRMVELLASVPAWRAADVVAAALSSSFQERLSVLRAVDHKQRVRLALTIVQTTLEVVRAGGGLSGGGGSAGAGWGAGRQNARVSRVVQDGGEDPAAGDDDPDGLDALMSRLAAARPPPEVSKAASKEYKRLRQSGEHQPGYGASRAYLETLADLPWSRTAAELAAERGQASATQQDGSSSSSKQAGPGKAGASSGDAGAGSASMEQLDLPQGAALSLKMARQLLDKQHYGLDKIKDRVIEHLAVLRLKGSTARAPILCFIGPPGVGKTSLARSVAAVLGRPFVRIALGGVRDEAEVRGHRRTYVGAMPGRILAGLRRARCCDPVMLLDELDKLGKDSMRGDPSAALLEVLDPEQNTHFTDAYLGLPCDLSRVMFVATANRAADIPGPLLDRLEVISLSGYTLEEKVHIACNHLLPKALADHGLEAGNVHLPDHVMELIVDRYTREAGVRALSRNLEALCRHVAVSIVMDHEATQFSSPAAGVPPIQYDAGSARGGRGVLGAVQASSHHMHSPYRGSEAAEEGHAQLHDSATTCTWLSTHLTNTTSLAAVSEAPLDRIWSAAAPAAANPHHHPSLWDVEHPALDAAAAHHQHVPADPAARPASGRPGLLSKVLGSGRQLTGSLTHPHTRLLVPHEQPAASRQPPSGSDTSANGQESASHSQSSHRHGWFSWRHSGSGAAQQPASSTPPGNSKAPGTASHGGWFNRGGGIAAVGSQPQVRYQGMPQALPYPPDLLQQHGVITVTEELVEQVLGPPRFGGAAEASEAVTLPGVAAGLVWTSVGGSVQFIECACINKGSSSRPGSLTLTGQVGEVLEESARIALSWIRAHASELGLLAHDPPALRILPDTDSTRDDAHSVRRNRRPMVTPDFEERSAAVADDDESAAVTQPRVVPVPPVVLQPAGPSPVFCWDVHVHLPAGSIPKDGPSAGITLAVALLSLLSGRVVRGDTAMTGELTLRGLVLPVGGIKEKLLAARHAGMTRVIVPARNMRDVAAEVPAAVRQALTIIPVERLEQVLAAAFDPPYALLPAPPLVSRL